MLFSLLTTAFAAESPASTPSMPIQASLAVLRQVGPDGKGSAEAARAWKALVTTDIHQLPEILAGMDGSNALMRNWVRSAIDDILERARVDKKQLPVAALEIFVRDTHHNSQARRLAYELILTVDAKAADRFLPNMTDDPSPELRRDAIARILKQADKAHEEGQKDEARRLYQKSFASAREQDHIDKAARRLRELGQQVDLPKHLGLILEWKLIGPFSNAKKKGVETVYPPEKQLDFGASYDGAAGKVTWTDYTSKDEHGLVDLTKGIGAHKVSVGYAAGEFASAADQVVEVRVGCYNAFKLWVNGELVLDRGDEFTGMRLDHYVAKAHLKQGKNTLLIKDCRGESQPGVPDFWQFQLRICDANGVAILSTTRPASPAPEKKS